MKEAFVRILPPFLYKTREIDPKHIHTYHVHPVSFGFPFSLSLSPQVVISAAAVAAKRHHHACLTLHAFCKGCWHKSGLQAEMQQKEKERERLTIKCHHMRVIIFPCARKCQTRAWYRCTASLIRRSTENHASNKDYDDAP